MKRRLYFIISSAALVFVLYQSVRLYMASRLFPVVVSLQSVLTSETGRFLMIGVAVYVVSFVLWLRSPKGIKHE